MLAVADNMYSDIAAHRTVDGKSQPAPIVVAHTHSALETMAQSPIVMD